MNQFFEVNSNNVMFMCLHILTIFHKDLMDGWRVTRQKVRFWPIWGFLGGFGPLSGPWGRNEFFRKKILQCTTRYENTTCCKIWEKSDGRLSCISPDRRTDGWTDGRTNGTDNYSLFPTKVGGLKKVNDDFSGTGTCKFEFSTIKSHHKDIHNNILYKSSKRPQMGWF